jgi:hypothetical protein
LIEEQASFTIKKTASIFFSDPLYALALSSMAFLKGKDKMTQKAPIFICFSHVKKCKKN